MQPEDLAQPRTAPVPPEMPPWPVDDDSTAAAGPPLLVLDPIEWSEEPPALRYLVEGLLPEGAPAILAGRSNSGKSMLGIEFSFAVATGRDLFGRKGPSEPMFAVFVELEDAPDEVHRRYLRCLDLFREDPSWNDADEANLRNNWRALVPNWSSRAHRMLPALVPYLQEYARALCANGGRVGLIVLDPLASLSAGEENKAETHQVFWSACYTLAEMTGSTPLVVHHVRKLSTAQGKGPSMSERLSFDSLRGSSAIVAAARAVLQVEPLTPEEAARVGLDEERAGAGNYVVLALTKNASGPKGTWMALEQKEAGEKGAGFFVSLPGGDRACAALRGKAAAAKLSLAESVLLSIANGIQDRKELATRHWPAESEEKAAVSLKTMLSHLRSRHGWLQKGRGFDLTLNGFTKVQEMRSLHGSRAGDFESGETSESLSRRGFEKVSNGDFDGDITPSGTATGSPARLQSVQAPPVPGVKVSMETKCRKSVSSESRTTTSLEGKVSKSPNPFRGNRGDLETFEEEGA